MLLWPAFFLTKTWWSFRQSDLFLCIGLGLGGHESNFWPCVLCPPPTLYLCFIQSEWIGQSLSPFEKKNRTHHLSMFCMPQVLMLVPSVFRTFPHVVRLVRPLFTNPHLPSLFLLVLRFVPVVLLVMRPLFTYSHRSNFQVDLTIVEIYQIYLSLHWCWNCSKSSQVLQK